MYAQPAAGAQPTGVSTAALSIQKKNATIGGYTSPTGTVIVHPLTSRLTSTGPLVDAVSPVRAIGLETQDEIHDEVMRRLFGDEAAAPTKFGRYEVVGKLGAGAMGSVYLARDPELDREVAIKILRLHLDSDRDRLVAEAQAMARLSHPNVVSVFDVGDHDGQIFVAMERVDGVNLRVWQEDERPWRETVRVYLEAARGLAAAHSAGVVHRDFKPDNVLVGRDGDVKVTDFGVATVLPHEALVETLRDAESESDPWLLATGGVGGTPAYMSPEQLRGLGSDPLSDQFSFCIALFEALAGYRPFLDDNLIDLVHRTTEGDRRAPPASSTVPGALWRIVSQGLAANPAQRHPSMAALCSAIEHCIRPPWRRRWALTSLAVVLASAAGGAMSYRHYQQAACTDLATEATRSWEAKRQSVREGLLAAAAGFAETTWEQVDHDLSQWTTAWQEERTDVCTATQADPTTQTRRVLCLDEQLRELGGLLSVLSTPDQVVATHALRAVTGLGDPKRCVDAQWLAATQPVPPPAEIQADVDTARSELGRAHALNRAGKDAVALEIAREQYALAQALHYAPLSAEAALLVGLVQTSLGDYKDAESMLVAAVSHANASGATQAGAQASLELLSIVGARLGRYDEGYTWGTLADGYIERLGPARRDLVARRSLLSAQVASRQGSPTEALVRLEEARAIYTEVDAPPLTWLGLWSIEATIRGALGESEIALELRRRVERETVALYGDAHPDVGPARLNLGIALARRGDFDGADTQLRAALKLNVDTFGADHPDNARMLNNLSNLASLKGDAAEAESLQRQAIALNEQVYGPHDRRLLDNLTNLGLIQLQQGRIDEALATLERTTAGYEANGAPDQLGLAEALLNLSTVTSAKQDWKQTKALLLRAKAIFDATSETVAGRGATLNNLANVSRALGEREEALIYAEEAAEVIRTTHGPDHPDHAAAHASRARLLFETGRTEAARDAIATLVPLVDGGGISSETVTDILLTQANLLWIDGATDQAQATARRALSHAPPKTTFHDAANHWLKNHP